MLNLQSLESHLKSSKSKDKGMLKYRNSINGLGTMQMIEHSATIGKDMTLDAPVHNDLEFTVTATIIGIRQERTIRRLIKYLKK